MNNDMAEMPDVVEQPASVVGQVAPKPLDFDKIDALRKHMLLTVTSMCKLLGVSRVAYYNWLKKDTTIRKNNEEQVRRVIRNLVHLVAQNMWPSSAVFQADQETRLELLQGMLSRLDKNNEQQ